MARKRMFRLDVLETDSFMEMPLSTQALYFHLNLRADDDGFIGNPKQIVRLIGASQNDLDLLIAKRFVLTFDDGVIVIKHWRMHNTLSANRYNETRFVEDKALLKIKKNKSYTFDADCEPMDDTHLIAMSKRQTEKDETKTNIRRTLDETKTNTDKGKVSIDKDSKDIYISKEIYCRENSTDLSDLFKKVIEYLNEQTGKKYRWQTKSTQKLISGRLSDGYSVDDFKRVIDIKCATWKGTKWEEYLRPETLFRPGHFESYLNQAPTENVESRNKEQEEWFIRGESNDN